MGNKRASAAKEYLVQRGIPGDRLLKVSYGKERPQCTESAEARWQKNRRVTLLRAKTSVAESSVNSMNLAADRFRYGRPRSERAVVAELTSACCSSISGRPRANVSLKSDRHEPRNDICAVVSKVLNAGSVCRKPIVLVVDDDRSVRRLMAMIVAQDGYATLEAENGTEAIHLAEANPVDLLVTDVEMPGMSGPELVLVLKQRGLVERSLMVTGNVDAIDAFRGSPRPVPVLAKPFNAGQLLESIHTILND